MLAFVMSPAKQQAAKTAARLRAALVAVGAGALGLVMANSAGAGQPVIEAISMKNALYAGVNRVGILCATNRTELCDAVADAVSAAWKLPTETLASRPLNALGMLIIEIESDQQDAHRLRLANSMPLTSSTKPFVGPWVSSGKSEDPARLKTAALALLDSAP